MQTVKALKKIIPELKERGYEFVTVSELLRFNEKFKIPLEAPSSICRSNS